MIYDWYRYYKKIKYQKNKNLLDTKFDSVPRSFTKIG